MRLYLEMGPLKGDEGEMRSQWWALIQCDLVTLEQDSCREDNHVQMQGGDGICTHQGERPPENQSSSLQAEK